MKSEGLRRRKDMTENAIPKSFEQHLIRCNDFLTLLMLPFELKQRIFKAFQSINLQLQSADKHPLHPDWVCL